MISYVDTIGKIKIHFGLIYGNSQKVAGREGRSGDYNH